MLNGGLFTRVNAAYGLTPEEAALMWRTAPPRMPLDPAEELRRLGAAAGAVEADRFPSRPHPEEAL